MLIEKNSEDFPVGFCTFNSFFLNSQQHTYKTVGFHLKKLVL
jgi:hypothetical protein